MPGLPRLHLFPVLLLLAAGCSSGGDQQADRDEFANIKEGDDGFLESVQSGYDRFRRGVASGREAIRTFNSHSDAEMSQAMKILQGNTSDVDWQHLDKAYLKEKAGNLKKMAAEAGINLNHEPTAAERARLAEAGRRLGITDRRSADLEAIFQRRRERLAEASRNASP